MQDSKSLNASKRYGIFPCGTAAHTDCWSIFDFNLPATARPIVVDHVTYIGAVNMLVSNVTEELASANGTNTNEFSKNSQN